MKEDQFDWNTESLDIDDFALCLAKCDKNTKPSHSPACHFYFQSGTHANATASCVIYLA